MLADGYGLGVVQKQANIAYRQLMSVRGNGLLERLLLMYMLMYVFHTQLQTAILVVSLWRSDCVQIKFSWLLFFW